MQSVEWLERNRVADGDEAISRQLLKISEEAGEAARAWIGVRGQNPRKGVTHVRSEVAAELADVVMHLDTRQRRPSVKECVR